ncbi:MAG: hypothetical protein KF778_14935 [Rhodocyclaceae bacterium]|nr:hypothetical protein [Rhodocyclaceae bacterium]
MSAPRNLDVTSTDGDIEQKPPAAPSGGATTGRCSSNITLDSPTNNFVGPSNAHGNNITVMAQAGWCSAMSAPQVI